MPQNPGEAPEGLRYLRPSCLTALSFRMIAGWRSLLFQKSTVAPLGMLTPEKGPGVFYAHGIW